MSSSHYTRYRAQARFRARLADLHGELANGAARRHLEVLIELLDLLLPGCGKSTLTDTWRDELDGLRPRVAARPNLKLIRP
jgi:hypothetical protein